MSALYALLCGLALAGPAEDYARGLEAARSGAHAEAVEALSAAVEAGGRDPAVYHALGNALYRQGRSGPALASWRRGQRLDPRNGDLAANIDRVRRDAADRIDPPAATPGAFFWLSFLSLAESAWLAGLLGLIGGGSLLLREVLRRRGRALSRAGLEVYVGLAGAALLGASTLVAAGAHDTVVVVAPEVSAVSALGPDGIELFVLHEGAEVALVEATAGAVLVALPDARKGWLPDSAVLRTAPAAPLSLEGAR